MAPRLCVLKGFCFVFKVSQISRVCVFHVFSIQIKFNSTFSHCTFMKFHSTYSQYTIHVGSFLVSLFAEKASGVQDRSVRAESAGDICENLLYGLLCLPPSSLIT